MAFCETLCASHRLITQQFVGYPDISHERHAIYYGNSIQNYLNTFFGEISITRVNVTPQIEFANEATMFSMISDYFIDILSPLKHCAIYHYRSSKKYDKVNYLTKQSCLEIK